MRIPLEEDLLAVIIIYTIVHYIYWAGRLNYWKEKSN